MIVYQQQKSSCATASGATTKMHQGLVPWPASSGALARPASGPPAPAWEPPAVKNSRGQSY